MRVHKRLLIDHLPATAAVLAMLAAVAVAHGQADSAFGGGDGGPGGPGGFGGPGGGPPHHMRHHPPTTAPDEAPTPVSGTVESYNRDPHGRVNGLVLHDGEKIIQLNAPRDWGESLAIAAPLNESITATAVPEAVVGDRTIERLVTLNGHGKTLTAGGPGERHEAHLDGAVAQLNYSPRGDLDGALLDSGDFVHVNPAAAAKLNLAVGQKLSVDGQAQPTSDGHQAIEAETVNGTHVPRPPGPGPGPGPEDRDGGGPGMRPMHGPYGGPDADHDRGDRPGDDAAARPDADDLLPPS